MIDASTQIDQGAIGNSSDDPLLATETAKMTTRDASTETNEYDNIYKNSIKNPSSPASLLNTPMDHSSPVDREDGQQQEVVESEDVLGETKYGEEKVPEFGIVNQELRDENAELRSSIVDLAMMLSREKKSAGAEKRVAAAEQRAAIAEERKAAGGSHDFTKDLAAAGSNSTVLVQNSLLTAEMAAHEQTREELAQLKNQKLTKDGQLETFQRRLEKDAESYDQLWETHVNLQAEFDKANLRISEFEVSKGRLDFKIRALQKQVDDLISKLEMANTRNTELEASTGAESLRRLKLAVDTLKAHAARLLETLAARDNTIRKGIVEVRFLMWLGTELHVRLDKAEKLLNGALGRDDGLMRLVAQRFPIPGFVEDHGGDVIEEEVDNNQPKLQLVPDRAPAGFAAMQDTEIVSENEAVLDVVDTKRSVSDLFEMQNDTAVDNGTVADVKADGCGSTSNTAGLRNTSSLESVKLSQQTAMPDVSGGQEARETSEDVEDCSDVENEGKHRTSPALHQRKLTRDHISPSTPHPTRIAPVNGLDKVETPANLALHEEMESAPVFDSAATPFTFGVQTSPNQVPQNNTEPTSSFNFTPPTDFAFGTAQTFGAGPIPFQAGSKVFGNDEREEAKSEENHLLLLLLPSGAKRKRKQQR